MGGGASVDKVASAVGIILSDAKVRRVLVNVFGGILRCDIAAEGIVQAYRTTGSQLPIVVRMLNQRGRHPGRVGTARSIRRVSEAAEAIGRAG